MPDAFTRTIPIWCAVINRTLFADVEDASTLHLMPTLTSDSERVQVEAIMGDLVDSFKKLGLDLDLLRGRMKRPVYPCWRSPALGQTSPKGLDESTRNKFSCLWLLMPSKYQTAATPESYDGYIQGAGDDSESWAHGLTPSLYWAHREVLLVTSEEQLPDLVLSLRAEEVSMEAAWTMKLAPFPQIRLGVLPASSELTGSGLTIICAPPSTSMPKTDGNRPLLHLKCREGKLGSRDLRAELPKVSTFVEVAKKRDSYDVCILCASGKDLSVGVALAIICVYGSEQGKSCKTSFRPAL
ncbi:MAG: hypothetical protein M1828_004902 [Chrysothrix sp. TS-e1954]|nr:MAG: hypothetical protein M1828_004902 [Chrysothrix sp. TS-e1954]